MERFGAAFFLASVVAGILISGPNAPAEPFGLAHVLVSMRICGVPRLFSFYQLGGFRWDGVPEYL